MRGATNEEARAETAERFQSTRPMRGATGSLRCAPPFRPYFNPRAPCGARRPEAERFHTVFYFNQRAPCGARLPSGTVGTRRRAFQSTRPMRGATRQLRQLLEGQGISIHAPHAGRDERQPCPFLLLHYFNPRAPCGARRWAVILPPSWQR